MGSAQGQRRWGFLLVNVGLFLLILLWTVPTFGLFVSSFRTREDIQASGWWNIFPHRAYETVEVLSPADMGLDPTGPMVIEGVETTFEELRQTGITTADGTFYRWVGNRRIGRIEIQEENWTVDWDFTLDNYRQVLSGKDFEYQQPDGTIKIIPGDDFVSAFLNSLAVAIPATVIPILVAAFAAYGFAWMRFPGRRLLFIMVVALYWSCRCNSPWCPSCATSECCKSTAPLWRCGWPTPVLACLWPHTCCSIISACCRGRRWNRRLSTARPILWFSAN